jgi:hypothetical protein
MDLSRLVYCYLSEQDLATRERMWLHVRASGGWMSYHPLGTLFYVQRECASPLLLLDPLIRRRPELDYLL